MNDEYQQYLQSPAWTARRNLLFTVRGKRCQACGFQKRLHVHHLTYERIFQEPLEDLLILCMVCHEIIERAVDSRMIGRFGNVEMLARRSLDIIRAGTVRIEPKPAPPKPKHRPPRRGNPVKIALSQMPDVMERMRTADRKTFKKFVRGRFSKGRYRTNAMMMWDRMHRV